MNRILITFFTCLSLIAVSCSSDDDPQMPTNAITLNMMIGDSDTTIGGSDAYINNSNNFTSSQCGIATLGKKSGFDRNPELSQIAREVAVTPGNYYQIMLARDIRTVAGARAFPVNSNYYNVYVDSWIYDKDNDIAGAKISYAECFPTAKKLPEWNSTAEVTMKSDKYTETAEYSFPKGCVIDDDFEMYDLEYSDMKDRLDVELNGNRILFSNSAWTPGGRVRVNLLVRYESLYTRVSLEVISSM